MMEKVTKKQFASGAIWKITEQISAKGVSFIVSLILARLLLPADYGIIAITTIFTNFSDVLIEGGFSTALIQKSEVDEYDYSCTFIASLAMATGLYLLIFISAPHIAGYYAEPILTRVLRVIGLVLFIQAFSSTRNAVVHRNMKFKLLFYCNLIGSLLSGIMGIVAAYQGFGVWSLVLQQLSQQIIVTILLFVKLHWRFKWKFKKERFKEIVGFSIGVMGAGLLNYIGNSFYNLVIGKRYSIKDLGYSDKGSQLPMQVSLYTFSSMSSVLLPTLSSYRDNPDTFKRILRKVVSMTSYIVCPMMFGMAVVSEELIVLLLTDKWLPALRIMQYACIYYLATPFMLINVQVFYALGHSFLRVKTEIIRLLLMLGGLLIFSFALECNISQLSLVSAVIAVLTAILTYYEVRKIISYKCREALRDIIRPLLASVIMMVVIGVVNMVLADFISTSLILSLSVKIIAGMSVYIFFSIVWKMDGYVEIKRALNAIRK